MNGITEITVGGVKYPLLFGRAAAEEMNTRLFSELTPNDFKVTNDLIYSGMMNYAISRDLPIPRYSDVFTISELLYDEDDGSEQYQNLWKVFQESKWGKIIDDKVKEAKKKIESLSTG